MKEKKDSSSLLSEIKEVLSKKNDSELRILLDNIEAQKQREIKESIKQIKSEQCHKAAEPYVEHWKKNVLPSLEKGGAESFVEWVTGMMKIAGAMEALFDMVSARLGNRFAPAVIWDTVKESASEVISTVFPESWRAAGSQVLNTISTRRKTYVSPPSLKDVEYSASLNDKGHLNVKLYMNGEPLTDKRYSHEEMFASLVESWLDSLGYHKELDKDKKYIYKNKDGEILTAEEFDKLNIGLDKEQGSTLNEYLQKPIGADIQNRDEDDYKPGMSP